MHVITQSVDNLVLVICLTPVCSQRENRVLQRWGAQSLCKFLKGHHMHVVTYTNENILEIGGDLDDLILTTKQSAQ